MYSRKQVFEETLKYFKGDELAANVWIDKYALKDQEGNIFELTPDDMHRRLAKEFARIEQKYPNPLSEEEIYELFKEFKYVIPGGSQMSGIGNNLLFTSLSNCFVIGSAIDSYSGIMKTDQEQVQVMKRRGGVGHDISDLRPSGALANNAILKGMSGAILYMERFSNSTREVSQGDRRGALMLSIDVRHPDVDRFIDIKLDQGKVTGANISVKISDDFMKAVERNGDFIQQFPIEAINKDLVLPEWVGDYGVLRNIGEWNNKPVYAKRIKARELWKKIIYNAWKSAEPGVLFWDKIIVESPAGCYGEEWKEKSTNPCGEIPLNPYDSCRLTAINLYSYVGKPFTNESTFNFEKFKKHVILAQRLMDDLIDLEVEKIDCIINKIKSDPEHIDLKSIELNLWEKIKQKAIEGRRTGLGITAEGDMLAALGIRYGTDEANDFTELVHKTLAVDSYRSSIIMAKERGCFPIWKREIDELKSIFVSRILCEGHNEDRDFINQWYKHGRRNIANLTVAPTGTVSLMTQTTSGLEPIFQPFYKRRRKINGEDTKKVSFVDEMGDKWEEFFVVHPKFIEWYRISLLKEKYSFEESYQDLIYIGINVGEAALQELFKDSPYFGATANDIDWEKKVEMQGRIQKWVDHSISVTTNLPSTATVEDVEKIYMKAWKSGCKGQTVYRDGCRSGVLISSEKKPDSNKFTYKDAFKRPEVTECDIYHKTALKQEWMMIVGLVNGLPYEIFTIKDINNHIFPSKIEKGRVTKIKSKTYKLTGILGEKQYNIPNIIDLMSEDERMDTRKYSSLLRQGMHPKHIRKQIEEFASVSSFDKVVYRVLGNYCDDEETKDTCPNCGSTNYHAENGCFSCPDCGYSKCG